ncbi:MAG: hypothetical protein QXZ25_05920 [Candidatus Bathyarchaeia archaeon]
MNWKNVVHLIRVDMKSGRLLRGKKLTKYRESKLFPYLLYGGALTLGLAVGVLVSFIYSTVLVIDPQLKPLFHQGLLSLFLSLPTLILIYSLIFTIMGQIQRGVVKFSIQPPYWLPITWEEHTLAAVLANFLGFLLASIIFAGSAILVVSAFLGQAACGILTFFTLLAAAFAASTLSEIFRVLQVRFIGAIYKSSGRAAVWVRFVGSILFLLVFYIIYFSIVSGAGALTFLQTVASAQNTLWFIPFLWLGMTLYSFINGWLLQTLIFSALSLLFISGLFYAAVALNKRYGLYEPPAITISSGVYMPRTGFLGRLGFSTAEAALIRKDFKAFTRRRELMYIFIVPILIVMPLLLQALGVTGKPMPREASSFLLAVIFLMPSAVVPLYLGSIMIGEEGWAIWRIYSSPISAESLVKSKYFFTVLFSALVTVVTGIVGIVAFQPSLRAIVIGLIEGFLFVFALGAVSLANGIKGADFTELPRPRMIQPIRSLINLIECLGVALAMLVPFIPYQLTRIPIGFVEPLIDPYYSLAISAVVAIIVASVAYRTALRNAREFLAKAEA